MTNYYPDTFVQRPYLTGFNSDSVPSPSFVIDLEALEQNLEILDFVQQKTGAKYPFGSQRFCNF